MMVFDLKHSQDITALSRLLASFQLHGVQYTLSYDASGNHAYLKPFGAHQEF